MADYLIKGETLTSIADAIREKTGSTEPILTEDMAQGVVAASEKYRQKLINLAARKVTEITEQDYDGLYVVGAYGFASCLALKTANLARSIVGTSNYSFQNCTGLESVNCNLSNIAYGTFEGCTSLKTFYTTSNNMSRIAPVSFKNCNKIVYLNFSNTSTVPELSNTNAFNGISEYAKIIVPNSLFSTFGTATNWANFSYMLVGADPNDEIGIIDINDPSGNFLVSFCFVKGMTWGDFANSAFCYVHDSDGLQLHAIYNVSGMMMYIDSNGMYNDINVTSPSNLMVEGAYTIIII